ncbi:hypothetical protein N7507_001986, partial [Penicillium longicatenatum]
DYSGASNSIANLISTLAPSLLLFIGITIFFVFTRYTYRHIYRPRTFIYSLNLYKLSPEPLSRWWNWHHSIDAYLILRFLKLSIVVLLIGSVITLDFMLIRLPRAAI